MPAQPFLPSIMWENTIRNALLEDLGIGGDLTTQALASPDCTMRAAFRARQDGVVAGLEGMRLAFTLLDPNTTVSYSTTDGTIVCAGDTLAYVEGKAAVVLGGERTALNILSHLSGIASVTRQIVDKVSHTKARVCCTRKTLPGLRAFQKYAVKAGGGHNHRYRLDDAILIKDNHLALCNGSITEALQKARAYAGHLVCIELEVDTLAQLEEALSCSVANTYLLDNMSIPELRQAVAMVSGRAVVEASGGITPDTAQEIAETGVDVLSMGWLTHSVKALDIGLDVEIA
ncbi:carboxylating nicotinate-nucleotide diphosphorylase [Acetobacter vaccinii]|uniref:Probable nicotinate-nucleotide pyrophosphorylase [carboxylating] n=1 Tax=Acetobacter vaccinii TaxID=2592655 RepID=A0A5C1YTN2_9PROT|nr:carboxylating nicotinate-nucleotide diphosphorylase [Acetobacter vaccinii]QEO18262.1 carboxylating nicotinate-nucleotide diphosphorylase [Acetobacter vaccinii]